MMESIDYWRLCDVLSVVDAALLIVGEDPSTLRNCIDQIRDEDRPIGYNAAKTALTHAIMRGDLDATLRYPYSQNDDGPDFREAVQFAGSISDSSYRTIPDWHQTTIYVNELKRWLENRGFETGFFFPDGVRNPDYLDRKNPRYALKLAAAVEAWEAVTTDEKLLDGKTPRQAIEKWLRENASRFGLTNEDGNPNKDGIEQISKVANWKPEGGAAKTKGNPTTPKKPNKSADF